MNQMMKRAVALLSATILTTSLAAVSVLANRASDQDPPPRGPAEATRQARTAQGQTENSEPEVVEAMQTVYLPNRGSPAPDSYFDDVVFVGDSISLKLKNFTLKRRNQDPSFLGGAQFLTVGGLGSGNVQLPVTESSLHPSYDGWKMPLEASVAATGAKKCYIMFGMNDIVPYGIDGAIANLDALINKIRAESPDIKMVVQSVTPILMDKQQRNLNNANVLLYNKQLKQLCDQRGYAYLDVGASLRGSNGALRPEYCGDAPGMGMHLSDAGCVPWIELLRANPLGGSVPQEMSLLRGGTLPAEEDDIQATERVITAEDDGSTERVIDGD